MVIVRTGECIPTSIPYCTLCNTYVRNWALQLFSQDYWTSLLTSLMLCVLILYISGGTYSLKVDSERQIFEKLFMAILFTLRVFARKLLRGNRQRNIFHIFVLLKIFDFGFESMHHEATATLILHLLVSEVM